MRVLWLSAVVVLLDQATKAAVVQLMYRHQSIPLLGDWLRLTFTENPGMAFGLTIGPTGTVTVLSLVATTLVALYVYRIRHAYAPYRWSLGLILGGAVGNIIDRVFYSVLLDYGPLFTGRVVDFIHVSLWRGFIPNVVPLLGGSYLELFPIWNVADMAIVLGVVGVMFFHRPFLERQQAARQAQASEHDEVPRTDAATQERPADDPPHSVSASHPDATNGTDRPHPASLSLPSPPRRDE
jgi:signal peptidase II